MDFNMADGNNFTFVDFLPEVRKNCGIFTSSTSDTFGTLIDRANDFLQSNQNLEIVTCESIEFECDLMFSNEMTYVERGRATSYIRGLRLWLTEKRNEKFKTQEIGYLNLMPAELSGGGIFSSPKFESLDTVIEKFNWKQRFHPVPGRIITIESKIMKDTSFYEFDPDRTKWTERTEKNTCFIFVLRIFYDKMADRSEEIGMKDFTPSQIRGWTLCFQPKYENFSTVVSEASAWLAQQHDLRFCNAQTLEIMLKNGNKLDTRRMHYSEFGSRITCYARILRVAYTKPFIKSLSIQEISTPVRELTYKTFSPVQLVKGICHECENLAATRERISAWTKAAGVRVLSSETTAYRLDENTEATSTINVKDKPKYWVFVIRLYLDGSFKEPPPEILPALPVVEYCCHVS